METFQYVSTSLAVSTGPTFEVEQNWKCFYGSVIVATVKRLECFYGSQVARCKNVSTGLMLRKPCQNVSTGSRSDIMFLRVCFGGDPWKCFDVKRPTRRRNILHLRPVQTFSVFLHNALPVETSSGNVSTGIKSRRGKCKEIVKCFYGSVKGPNTKMFPRVPHA